MNLDDDASSIWSGISPPSRGGFADFAYVRIQLNWRGGGGRFFLKWELINLFVLAQSLDRRKMGGGGGGGLGGSSSFLLRGARSAGALLHLRGDDYVTAPKIANCLFFVPITTFFQLKRTMSPPSCTLALAPSAWTLAPSSGTASPATTPPPPRPRCTTSTGAGAEGTAATPAGSRSGSGRTT